MAAIDNIRTGDIAVVAQSWLDYPALSLLKSRSGENEYCQNETRAIII